MLIRSIIRSAMLLAFAAVGSARAQAPAESRTLALAHFRAVAESSATQQTWSGAGAIIGGVGGGAAFAAAFYKFSHRDGAVNHTEGTLGGTLVGTAFGAA